MARSVTDLHIKSIEPLASPDDLQRRLPLTPAMAQLVAEGRDQVQRILTGEDPRLLVIVGPCSIHDEKAASNTPAD